jgi:hypothetical protein
MKDDPAEIAKYLIQQLGIDAASLRASQAAYEAQEKGDLYDLSIWRDVRRLIAKEKDTDQD